MIELGEIFPEENITDYREDTDLLDQGELFLEKYSVQFIEDEDIKEKINECGIWFEYGDLEYPEETYDITEIISIENSPLYFNTDFASFFAAMDAGSYKYLKETFEKNYRRYWELRGKKYDGTQTEENSKEAYHLFYNVLPGASQIAKKHIGLMEWDRKRKIEKLERQKKHEEQMKRDDDVFRKTEELTKRLEKVLEKMTIEAEVEKTVDMLSKRYG